MKTLFLILTLLFLTGCTDKEGATRALTYSGYTNISITGFSFTGCAEDDIFHTRFIAQNPRGMFVNGIVCFAPFKGATIRF